ncbi:hypothetical protein SK128_008095, partial [Halocaridina rubra]
DHSTLAAGCPLKKKIRNEKLAEIRKAKQEPTFFYFEAVGTTLTKSSIMPNDQLQYSMKPEEMTTIVISVMVYDQLMKTTYS